MRSEFLKGLGHGVPIALGYLSVSFGIGIMAVKAGISINAAVIMSAVNLTSAGQAAGIGIIASGGALIEMILAQFTINLRYSLMSLSLSQKLDSSFTLPQKLIASFGVTDEIFAVAVSRPNRLTAQYMYGLILMPMIGWTLGTFIGAFAGELLPPLIANAMSIMLYGMFIAIIIPPSRREKNVFIVVLAAAAFSCVFKFFLPGVSGGFAIIISAVAASVIGAIFFPIKEVRNEK